MFFCCVCVFTLALFFLFHFLSFFSLLASKFSSCISCSGQQTTGAIFEDNTFYNDVIRMLQYATAEANDKILPYSGMRLGFEVQTIAHGREYTVSKRVCNLLEVFVRSMTDT